MPRYWSLAALTVALVASGMAFAGMRLAPASAVAPDSLALADAARRACTDRPAAGRRACYQQVLVTTAAGQGVRVALGTLERLAALDNAARTGGHVLAHAIGIAAGHLPGDVGATFASCTPVYQSGCYHGVIQAYFTGADTVDAARVNALCRAYAAPAADQWLRFQCAHGMGHGLTMFYRHDLPRALAACDQLVTAWDRESCYGGAFMENIVNAIEPHHAAPDAAPAGAPHHDHNAGAAPAPAFRALDRRDPHYPCTVVAARYLEQCYVMQATVMLWVTDQDVAKAARHCATSPGRFAYTCHESLGREVAARAQGRARAAVALCGKAAPLFQPWCHFGVAKDIVGQRGRFADGLAYCAAIPGTRNKLKCYEAVGEQIGALLNPAPDRSAACVAAEEQYRAACLYGARVTLLRPLGLPVPREVAPPAS